MTESYSAQISCMLYNINRGENPAAKIDDFMIHKLDKEPPKKQDWKQMKNAAKAITAAFGGKIK